MTLQEIYNQSSFSGRVDIIVVGAGGSGLIAAMTAADEGARVLHLEKTDRIGGCWLPGIGNAGSTSGAQTMIQFESGILDDSSYRFYADCMRDPRARVVCDPEILSYYCRQSGRAVDWLDRLGTFSKRERRAREGLFGEDWTVLRSYYMDTDFLKLVIAAYQKRVGRGDIHLMMGTEAKTLVYRRGLFTGVVTASGGKSRVFRAKSVIICTGGFGADINMVRRYNLPEAELVTTVAMPFATGDGLRMCQDLGAQMVNTGQTMVMGPFLSGIPDPSRPGRELARVDAGCPGVILVNCDGQRLVNEDCGRLSPKLRDALLKCPGHRVVVIFDHRTVSASQPIVTDLSREWVLEQAENGRLVKKALSISELADKTGISQIGLVSSVARWNEQVRAGSDAEFGRGGMLLPVAVPPYYAIPLGVRVVSSSGGPTTNVRQQVIDKDGRTIRGLYAAGEVTGYQGYGTGMLNTGCVVFGRQAGKMAAREALRQVNGEV